MFSSSLSFGGYGGASQADVAMEPTGTQTQTRGPVGEKNEMLLPVTLKMVDAAVTAGAGEDGDLRIDGKNVNTILIVGCVADVNKQSTAMEFSVNDSTGTMRARYYFTPEMQKTLEQVDNGTYVTIVGIVKTKPSLHVSVLTMRPVQSPDEISYHEIQVAHASLKSKKKGSAEKFVSSPTRPETPVHSVVTPLRRNEEATKESLTQAPPMMATPPKIEGPLKDRISKFLAEPKNQNPEGVARSILCQTFSDSKAEEITASISELLDEGLAYTTIDDDHFACV